MQPPGYYDILGKAHGTHICVPYNLPEIVALPITAYLLVICREGS